MKRSDGFRPRFRVTDHAPDPSRDAGDEIAFHLEMRERELISLGVPPEEARRRTRETFGDAASIQTEVESIDTSRIRQRRVVELLESIGQDLRFGVRGLLRNPGFALAAVITLGLGIGANAMVFGLLEATLLRPPAVRSPETLAAVYTTCRGGNPRCTSSYPDIIDYRERTRSFDDLAAYTRRPATIGGGDGAELVAADLVTGNYFTLLGVRAAEGRLLLADDDAPPSGLPVAVLSHAFWRSRFGGERNIVGRRIDIGDIQFTIVGVADPSFDGLRLGTAPALWLPLHRYPGLSSPPADPAIFEDRGSRWIEGLVARLAPGISVETARAELLGVSRQLAQEDSAARGPRTVTVDPLPSYVLPPGAEGVISSFIWVLQGVVGVTLLLACANLANLLLARGLGRQRELAVRAAIGAGRGRIVRQLLTESLLLGVLGAAVGLGLAYFALSVVARFQLPFDFDIAALGAGINGPVATFTALLALVTVAAFGTLPAMYASRGNLAGIARTTAATRGQNAGRMLGALVAVQVALCVVLLAGAGLFLRTLRNHLQADLGFRPDGIAVMRIDPSTGGYEGDAAVALVRELTARTAAIPGVEKASVSTGVPVLQNGSGFFVRVDGYTPGAGEEMRLEVTRVGPDFLRASGIPLVRGREFTEADGPGAGRVMIINEQMARTWWPGRDPIGGTVHLRNEPYTVVGIARNVPGRGLDPARVPQAYAPMLQSDTWRGSTGMGPLPRNLYVTARATPERLDGIAPLMREAVRATDPRIPVADLVTMRRAIATALAPQRGAAALLSVFAALALVLASVGIYGVLAYSVSRQRRELGIRMALGARAGSLVSLVARGMGIPVAIGVIVGLITGGLLGRVVEGLIFGVEPTDPASLAGAVAILVVAATIATLGPARRAARTDPTEIMRGE